jgi:hypothetical protein
LQDPAKSLEIGRMTVHANATSTPDRVIVVTVGNRVMGRVTANASVTSTPTSARIVHVKK